MILRMQLSLDYDTGGFDHTMEAYGTIDPDAMAMIDEAIYADPTVLAELLSDTPYAVTVRPVIATIDGGVG